MIRYKTLKLQNQCYQLSALGLCFCFDHNFFPSLFFHSTFSSLSFFIFLQNSLIEWDGWSEPSRLFCSRSRRHIASNRKILIDVWCSDSLLILFLVTSKIYWSIKVKETYTWRQFWCLDEMHKSQNQIYYKYLVFLKFRNPEEFEIE